MLRCHSPIWTWLLTGRKAAAAERQSTWSVSLIGPHAAHATAVSTSFIASRSSPVTHVASTTVRGPRVQS